MNNIFVILPWPKGSVLLEDLVPNKFVDDPNTGWVLAVLLASGDSLLIPNKEELCLCDAGTDGPPNIGEGLTAWADEPNTGVATGADEKAGAPKPPNDEVPDDSSWGDGIPNKVEDEVLDLLASLIVLLSPNNEDPNFGLAPNISENKINLIKEG